MMIIYKDHHVTSSPNVFYEAKQSELCRLHPDFMREKYCMSCDLTLCRLCLSADSHTGHDLKTIDDLKRTLGSETQELEGETKASQSQIRKLLSEVRSCTNRKMGCFQDKLMADSREGFQRIVELIK